MDLGSEDSGMDGMGEGAGERMEPVGPEAGWGIGRPKLRCMSSSSSDGGCGGGG